MGHLRIAVMALALPPPFLLAQGSSDTHAAAPSQALRTHLRAERFTPVTTVGGLPSVVRDGLKQLFGSSTLEMAEPGAEFQATDVVTKPDLPIRRLISAGCSGDHCLVYYERGGIAHTRHVVLFAVAKAEARFEWGGSAPSGLADLDEVKGAVLSGAVKGPSAYW